MKYLVPMRSGSKRIPHKNISLYKGKPLFYWTLKHLPIKDTWVSTDSLDYVERVQALFPQINILHRAPELATDEATTNSVIKDWIDRCDIDGWFTFCQVTNPFITKEQIIAAQVLAISTNKPVAAVVDDVEGHFVTGSLKGVKLAEHVYRLAGSFWILHTSEPEIYKSKLLPFPVAKVEIC